MDCRYSLSPVKPAFPSCSSRKTESSGSDGETQASTDLCVLMGQPGGNQVFIKQYVITDVMDMLALDHKVEERHHLQTAEDRQVNWKIHSLAT